MLNFNQKNSLIEFMLPRARMLGPMPSSSYVDKCSCAACDKESYVQLNQIYVQFFPFL